MWFGLIFLLVHFSLFFDNLRTGFYGGFTPNLAKHQRGFLHEKASTLMVLKTSKPYLAEKVTEEFLCADIPLHKLRSSHLSSLFQQLGNPLPSEGKCRSKVEKLAEEEVLPRRIKRLFEIPRNFYGCE